MENEYVKLSDAVAKLLTEDNKDKNLGEVSTKLNRYLIEIKDLVESKEISYEKLRKEIQKHINVEEDVRPGSVAQLLVGCVNEKECPLQKEKAMDVSFIYDHKLDKIVPLTNIMGPITDESYCVIYINGSPNNIKPEALLELEKMGFKKLRIKHKNVKDSKYSTIDITDIQTMINENQPLTKRGAFIIAIFLVLLLLLYIYR